MNFGGTVRISRCGVFSLLGLCALIVIYYLYSNREAKGTLVNTFKEQLSSASAPKQPVDLARLLAVAIQVAERGGAEVRQVRKDADLEVKVKGKTREGVVDPLTEGDLRSHFQMYNGLKKMFPGLTVISEEHSTTAELSPDSLLPLSDRSKEVEAMAAKAGHHRTANMDDITVWIDPLDATKEYTENLLQYVTTMVCVAVSGRPVIGVIHQPFKDTGVTYWAWVGRGYSNSLHPAPAPTQLPSPVKVMISRSHAGETETLALKAFGQIERVTAAGAGYKTLSVLEGTGDVYLHATLVKKWDTCAPNALLVAAGGQMTTLDGAVIDYDSRTGGGSRIEKGLLGTLGLHDQYLAKIGQARTS